MRIVVVSLAFVMMLASTASSQQGGFVTPPDGPESARLATTYDPTRATVITAADIAAATARLPQDGVSANGTFVERRDPDGTLAYRIAVDRRRTPQRAASHAEEAELWAVVDGAGTITTGGTLVETRKGDEVVSRVIEGGVSTRVARGDIVVIPEGVPHYVTEADPQIVFVTIEFPRPAAAPRP